MSHHQHDSTGNLNADATSDDLTQFFGKYGKVESVWVARKPPGFAFITFTDEKDAKDALAETDGTNFQGQRLKVEYSRPPRNSRRRDGARDSYRRDRDHDHDDRHHQHRGRDRGHARDGYSRSRRSPSGGRIRSRSPSYGRPRQRSRSRSGHK